MTSHPELTPERIALLRERSGAQTARQPRSIPEARLGVRCG
ncbi:MAG: hypothetical protein U0974_04930 [Gemmatimonadales bacterium]|nr:hypothetical protein [Gemmatimonadales bacterium]MDZ4389052.1 hypothetical protein [Gemmatimonadales bacterium]